MWSAGIEDEIPRSVAQEWDIVRLDWTEISDQAVGSPGRGYRLGAEIGRALVSRPQPYTALHLVAHSMGAHVIQGVADIYRAHAPDAAVQMTFIDSFVAGGLFTPRFGKREFGRNSSFAESYVTTHGPPIFTNALLSQAHNFDLSFTIPEERADDRNYAHIWPVHYYLRSGGTDGPGLSLSPYTAFGDLREHCEKLRALYPPGQVTTVN